MKLSSFAVCAAIAVFNTTFLHAQTDGSADASFDAGSGINGPVNAVLVQADGKILIAGEFTTVRGAVRSKIARLNENGTVDDSFNPGAGANNHIRRMAVGGGKILIGGLFTNYNGTARARVALLNSNGSLDPSFNINIPTGDTVESVAIGNNMWVGGTFPSFGTNIRLLRLDSSGNVLSTYMGASGPVDSIEPQNDNTVLLGGRFINLQLSGNPSIARSRIAKINSDGSVNENFVPGTPTVQTPGPNDAIFSLKALADGRVLIGGNFTFYDSAPRGRAAIISADAEVDTNFNFNSTVNGAVLSVSPYSGGKVMIAGQFSSIDFTNRGRVVRLNGNGSLDSGFDPGTGIELGSVNSMAVQADGKVLVGGTFTTVNGIRRSYLARFNDNGSLDTSFNLGTKAGLLHEAVSIDLQPDKKILVAGFFSDANGVGDFALGRLNTNGTYDAGFTPGVAIGDFLDPDGMVYSVKVLPDGKILIGDFFINYNGTPCNNMARLNADGSFDSSFTGSLPSAPITLFLQSDGKIVAGWDGGARISRFDTNGNADATFNPGLGASGGTFPSVNAIAQQSDGKLVVGGIFTSFDGVTRTNMARLNTNGTLDASFVAHAQAPNAGVAAIAIQSSGKILIGGSFLSVNGTNRTRIARLNDNGSLDLGFNPGSGIGGTVAAITIQGDGKILVGGNFTTVNGTNRTYITRLNSDGSLDLGFNSVANDRVTSIALQNDGKVMVGGRFSIMGGAAREHVARLNNTITASAMIQITNVVKLPNGNILLQCVGVPLATHTVAATSNLLQTFQPVGTPAADGNGNFQFEDTSTPSFPMRFYRIVQP